MNYYADIIKQNPPLSKDEEFSLLADKNNKSSFDKIVLSNLALVIKLAQKKTVAGINIEDLIEYGIIGLIRAVNNFDINLGLRFSTYATYCINSAIIVGIKKMYDADSNYNVPISIDALNRNDRDYLNYLDSGIDIESDILDRLESNSISRVLGKLSKNERLVIQKSIYKAGKELGISHEWARQIRKKAIAKLRFLYAQEMKGERNGKS